MIADQAALRSSRIRISPCRISVPSTFRHSRMKAASPGQPLADTRLPSTWAPVGGNIDVDAAGQRHFRLAILKRGDLAAAHDAVDRDQDLHAMADGEDRLAGFVEVPDDRLHALVDTNIFRAAAAGAVHGVIVLRPDLRKRLVDV